MAIFICGITGNQGSSMAKHLLLSPNCPPIYGLTRDPSSEASQHITSLGATLFPGSYADVVVLQRALATCTALFLNLSPDLSDTDYEPKTARVILEHARAAGVKHVVYSSNLSADAPASRRRRHLLGHWDPQSLVCKMLLRRQEIEQRVQTSGFETWTILRPGNFMANFTLPLVQMYPGLVQSGQWSTALERESLIPLVDVDTIGRFACAACLEPARFHAAEINLADEFLTADQVLQKLSVVTARPLRAVYMTDDDIAAQKANPIVMGMLLMRDLAQFVDLSQLKKWHLPMSSMDNFLQRERQRVMHTYKQT